MRHLPTALAVVAVAAAVTACGGGSSGGGSSGGAKHAQSARAAAGLEFSRCMRRHGLTSFPDVIPGQGLPIQHELDGSVDIIINGVPQPVDGPAFDAAMNACNHYAVSFMSSSIGAGTTPGTIQRALVQTADCMRSHSVSNYPDPPALGTQKAVHMSPTGRARSAGIDIDSPAFKNAITKCGSILSSAMGR